MMSLGKILLDHRSLSGIELMLKSITTSSNINLPPPHSHRKISISAPTILKVEKSTVTECPQLDPLFINSSHFEVRIYDKRYTHEHETDSLTPSKLQAMNGYPKINRDIRRIHETLPKGIYKHASVRMPCKPTDNPDAYRNACIRALNESGIDSYVIFGLDEGPKGNAHIHMLFKGRIIGYYDLFNKTGLQYHVIDDDDRGELYNLEGHNVKGFYSTAAYCLKKPNPHKKKYRIIKRQQHS